MKCNRCYHCKQLKPLEECVNLTKAANGKGYLCILCKKLIDKEYYIKNKARLSAYCKAWRAKNKEYKRQKDKEYRLKNVEKCKKNSKLYQEKNKEKYLKYQKEYRNKNPLNILKARLRSRLSGFLSSRRFVKTTKFVDYLSCSIDQLKIHLESQFKPGMSWDNYGKWHVDHIKPLISAKSEEEIYKLCHYTNLQPLWAEENLKKNRY